MAVFEEIGDHNKKNKECATNKENGNNNYTWRQVAQHNTANSCWVIESGKVFDVTEFVNKHPGGKDFFLLAAGRDVTDLLPMV